MTHINDGGPAFPVDTHSSEGHQSGPNTWQYPGITMRDYFAATALQGLITNPRTYVHISNQIADHAYRIADAMIGARNK